MKTSTHILPGVLRIGYVRTEHLPRAVALHGICRQPVALLTDVEWLDFFDTPDCRCRSEKDSAGYTDTASLKFHCARLIPFCEGLGFVVQDIQGAHYLIGAQEPPLPRVAVELLMGAPDGESGGFRYEVTHTAIKSLIPCVVSS